jgi:hypothetical protein
VSLDRETWLGLDCHFQEVQNALFFMSDTLHKGLRSQKTYQAIWGTLPKWIQVHQMLQVPVMLQVLHSPQMLHVHQLGQMPQALQMLHVPMIHSLHVRHGNQDATPTDHPSWERIVRMGAAWSGAIHGYSSFSGA